MSGEANGRALPGEECQLAPHESWTELEKWVWHEIGSGRIADKWFIDYGYGQRLLWRPLAWVAGLVALGTVVLNVTGLPAEFAGSQAAAVTYSFDTLLPLIQLEKAHADISVEAFARYYFYFQKLMGYVLASSLIAGLAGLTK